MSIGFKFFLKSTFYGLAAGGAPFFLLKFLTDVPFEGRFWGFLIFSIVGLVLGILGWIFFDFTTPSNKRLDVP
jgi:hypothetical protein